MTIPTREERDAIRKGLQNLNRRNLNDGDPYDWPGVMHDLLDACDQMEAEISRHHQDFEKWEAMAEKGSGLVSENAELRSRSSQLEDALRHACETADNGNDNPTLRANCAQCQRARALLDGEDK